MGTIDAQTFMEYLKRNDLVIAPAAMIRVDRKPLQIKALKKPALAYGEISAAGLWGDITQKRVYQLAKQFSREGEIIRPGENDNSPEKILTGAVKRIAILRNIDEVAELIYQMDHANR